MARKPKNTVMAMEAGTAVLEALPLSAGGKVRKFPDVPEALITRAKTLEAEKRQRAVKGIKNLGALKELNDLWATIRETQATIMQERRVFELAKQARAKLKREALANA